MKVEFKSAKRTGAYSYSNTGPAATAMSIEYQKGGDVDIARVREEGNTFGQWSMSDVSNALTEYGVKYGRSASSEVGLWGWRNMLRSSVAIVKVNMHHLKTDTVVGKDVTTLWPWSYQHLLLIDMEVGEDESWFKVYNPADRQSTGDKYRYADLNDAIRKNDDYIITVRNDL